MKNKSWAYDFQLELQLGETISFRPEGNSMAGRIESGQLCTVEPVNAETNLAIDDIVLCKVNGKHYLHLIKDIKNNQYQIGNNKGYINGWIPHKCLYGKLIKVEN